ncbi:unnamed protein product (mitochondrion) [Plasmodiophora brassicae]|uniref:25S rRNA (uridine-N(3))-methyltransferase BMT5-like domain-containing protein n=1 Tax=Plasmodiophora brassicae TaxID=37360 RepID=A0A0G4IKG0_PLABS|nr:hypothetical protein PBRA_004375 [Plasmodiophora brassicae]SPR00515.1 unnamed protein product [Plasmodiophora brassicae]
MGKRERARRRQQNRKHDTLRKPGPVALPKRVGVGNARKPAKADASSLTVASLVTMPGHVLIVGDGDFSFSRAVASIRGSHVPGDLQCTSLDSASTVTAKYPRAQQHLASLHTHPSCTVRHSVDATNLHGTNFSGRLFSRIVFMFPHTGKQRVHMNRNLISEFLSSCEPVLAQGGLVLVTIKDRPPYSRWNIAELAVGTGLELKAKLPFDADEFPGYAHRTTDPTAKKLVIDSQSANTFVFGRPRTSG